MADFFGKINFKEKNRYINLFVEYESSKLIFYVILEVQLLNIVQDLYMSSSVSCICVVPYLESCTDNKSLFKHNKKN